MIRSTFNKVPRLNRLSGGDNNLAVILRAYEPEVQCGVRSIFTDAPSCGGLLADMPATTEKTLFGPGDVPGVQEPLPQGIISGKASLDPRSRP